MDKNQLKLFKIRKQLLLPHKASGSQGEDLNKFDTKNLLKFQFQIRLLASRTTFYISGILSHKQTPPLKK